MQEEDHIQQPNYHISHILRDAETCQSEVEKLVLVLVLVVWKLRAYFQDYKLQ